jgi:hypothetical protein
MKKVWNAPKLANHGNVEAITEQTKFKRLGSGDDFASNISTVG